MGPFNFKGISGPCSDAITDLKQFCEHPDIKSLLQIVRVQDSKLIKTKCGLGYKYVVDFKNSPSLIREAFAQNYRLAKQEAAFETYLELRKILYHLF